MVWVLKRLKALGAEKAESFNWILDLNLRTFFHK